MDSLKIIMMKAISTNWNLMRMLRLVVGIWGIYVSVTDAQPLFGILGGMFILKSILNVGCCGSSGCTIPQNKNHEKNDSKEVTYEEVR